MAVRTLMAAAMAAFSAAASDVTVFRLEEDNATGEMRVVGVDGARRPVLLADPTEYAVLTAAYEQVWKAWNSTDSGRRRLHGKVKGRISIADDGVHYTYEDGYVHVEPPARPPVRPDLAVRRIVKQDSVPKRPSGTPERLWDISRKVEAARKAKAVEVRVDYDAGTGRYIERKKGGNEK